jgi:hypothetical protein
MSVVPGKYAGYGIRPKGPGSARRWMDPLPEAWVRNMARAQTALAEPFRGVTTDGHAVPGLFPVMQTGVSTRPILDAGEAFVRTMSPEQRQVAMHPVDSQDWRRWCNWEQYTFRHGLSLEEMALPQRDSALALMRESLSARGFETARNVMKLNQVLGEITGNLEWLGEWIYFFSIFGTPSATEPWGWQLDGHHLNLNYFVMGDQVVMTPGFWGAEPNVADRGEYSGLSEFGPEERHGLELIRALNPLQQARAIIHRSMLSTDQLPGRYTFNDGRQQSVAFKDNALIAYEGIRADSLDRAQQDLLLQLIRTYTSHLREGHDEVWMQQVRLHLNDTWFAWIGGTGDKDTFYYKVYSPVLLIEFDMHKGVFLDNEEPEKFHVHIIVRTPNGNDYGGDLLRQHLMRDHQGGDHHVSHHHGPHGHGPHSDDGDDHDH